jgi:hypothetical protein
MSTVNFDFDSIKGRILKYLQTKSEWADFLDYGTDSLINEAISQELAYESQYKEYLTNENWWSKARNKSSLLVESPVHGYIVPRKYGSTGTLMVSTSSGFNTAYINNVFIPKYFEFSNGSLTFCNIQDYTLSSAVSSGLFTAVQGQAKSSIFTALGTQFEKYIINDPSVENNYYDLYVNNVLWTRVDTLFDYDGTSLVYEIQTDPSLTFVTLLFGNGTYGKQLIQGDSIEFYYISTEGNKGNVSVSNNITTVDSQAYDTLGNTITLFVTNTTSFLGGKDYPSLEEIRALSPRVYQTGDRAGNNEDYTTILGKLSFITKVSVWGVFEYCQDNNLDPWTFIPTEENVVHIAALNNAYQNLTTLEKTNAITTIHSNCDPTDLLEFSTVIIINLIFTINVVVKNSTYKLDTVITNVTDTLNENYSIENISFTTDIYDSDFKSLIDAVEGVDHFTSNIQVEQYDLFSNAYKVSSQLYQYPIKGDSLEVYVSNNGGVTYTLIATGDSNGNINGKTGYNTVGSVCNLTTGELLLIVNSGLTDIYTNYTIKYLYNCANIDLTLNQRYYIYSADLYNSIISASY